MTEATPDDVLAPDGATATDDAPAPDADDSADAGNGPLARREALRRAGSLGVALGVAGCAAPGSDPSRTESSARWDVSVPSRPNVVVVYVDDLGWLDTAFQGSQYYRTPNLDAMAESGLTFRSGYAPAPNCAPSRACLLTGQSTPRHGVYTVGYPRRVAPNKRRLRPPRNNRTLSTDHATVGEMLSAAGYDTGFVGKWHVGEAGSERGPLARGFDRNVGGSTYGYVPSGYFPPYDLPNLSDDGDRFLTRRLTDSAVRFVRDHAAGESPFFLLFSTYAVHTPLQAPERNVAPFRDARCWNGQCNPTYAGMVRAVDRAVGRIRATLSELGIAEETLVVFASDNGGVGDYGEVGVSGDWSQLTSQGPLRAGKGTLYEGGIRVPFVASWPGVLPSATVSTPVTGTDLFPTLVDLAGAADAVPDDHPVDGASLVPLFERGRPPDREALFWHFPAYLPASVPGEFRTTPVSVVRKGRWKLHRYYQQGRTELYDLQTDIGERTDLSAARPERRNALLRRLARWKRRVGAQDPRPK